MPRRRRRQRGATIIELAIGMGMLVLVFTGGLHFADAIYVKQHLTTATTQATRYCAVRGGGAGNAFPCIQQQMALIMGTIANRCNPNIQVQGGNDPNNVNLLRVTATCDYTGGPWSNFLRDRLDLRMSLHAQAVMPVEP